jgi:hypothetical protein
MRGARPVGSRKTPAPSAARGGLEADGLRRGFEGRPSGAPVGAERFLPWTPKSQTMAGA